jgi:alpha-tubulin suppressor-like RCC1 family protein
MKRKVHLSYLFPFLPSLLFQVPTPVKELHDINVRQIAAGENHSACATDTGKLITFGKERERERERLHVTL